MKKTIWKYTLETMDFQTLEIPKNAQLLTIQVQGTHCRLWALVDPEEATEERDFEIFGTGNPVHCDMGVVRSYIGSYQLHGGELVFHVFERLD